MSETVDGSDGDDPRGPYADMSDIELPDEVIEYLEEYVKPTQSERTYYNERTSAKHYLTFCEEKDIDFFEPTNHRINRFEAHQKKHGYSNGSVENRVYDLSTIFRFLAEEGHATKNPMDDDNFDAKISRGSSAMSNIRYIEVEEYERLIDEIDKLRDEVLVRGLWELGVRAIELVNIKIDDIDRDEREVTVATAKQEEDKERSVFFSMEFEKCLVEWLDRGGRDSYLSADESPYLLLGQSSEQLDPRRPTEVVSEYAEEAGVQAKLGEPNAAGQQRSKVTAHCFRHSYAVHRTKSGIPIIFLKELLGHSDISQTRAPS